MTEENTPAVTETPKAENSESKAETRGRSIKRRGRRRNIQQARQSLEYREAMTSVDDNTIELSKKELDDIDSIAETPEEADKLKRDAIAAKTNIEALRRAKEQVNKSVPAEHIVHRPGYGAISGEAVFHTTDAFRFLLGREQRTTVVDGKKRRHNQIIGLLEAASAVKRIEQGYRQGCPYAAWTLVKIEEAMNQLNVLFAESAKEADELIKSKMVIEAQPFTSKTPATIQLNFISNYAFHFTNYLSQYDLLLRPVVSARILGFVTDEEFRVIERKMGTPLRSLFRLVSSWEFVGEEAVKEKNAKYLEAEHKMGILPKDILSNELRPQMAKEGQSTERQNV